MKHRTAENVKFERCKKSNGGKVDCQTLNRKKLKGTKECKHGSKCAVM
jgi:hypothetical protein